MSTRTRNQPVAVMGQVSVLAPTGSGRYYRLTWTNPDGTGGGTSAGQDLDGDRAKAGEIDQMLTRSSGPLSMCTLGEIRDAYLASPIGRQRTPRGVATGKDWSPGHHKSQGQKLRRGLRGFELRRAFELDATLVAGICAQAGTASGVHENTVALRGMLRWGRRQTYFTDAQVALLPVGVEEVEPALVGTPAPARRTRARDVADSPKAILDEDAPDRAMVIALGEQMALLQPRWGRLAPELAASSGLRWGEQFQLRADDLVLTTTPAEIRVDWQINSAAKKGENRRKRPKGEKTRVVGIPAVTFTGYPLREKLAKRRVEALAEQARGVNPEALLFPTGTGVMWQHTAFHDDVLDPAATAAGWEFDTWTERKSHWVAASSTYVTQTRERKQFRLTWHSCRHRFARYALDVLGLTIGELMLMGGWDNRNVVETRYYRPGLELRGSALAKFT